MTIHLAEALVVKRAAEKHGRITQIGTQIHAGANYRRVVEWVRSGALGKIGTVRTFLAGNQGAAGIGNAPFGDPPKDLDWDFWLGPTPLGPCHPKIIESAGPNCSFLQYSGGYTPGMAPHIIDLPFWAMELGIPPKTVASGGRYVTRDAGDAYDTQQVLWQYPKLTVTWMLQLVNSYGFDLQGASNAIRRRLGVYFHGVDATLYADYGTHKVVPEGDRLKDLTPPEPSIPPSPGHEREQPRGAELRGELHAQGQHVQHAGQPGDEASPRAAFRPGHRADRRRRRGGEGGAPRVPGALEVPGEVPVIRLPRPRRAVQS